MTQLMMYAPLVGAMVLASGCFAESAIECNVEATAEELDSDTSHGDWDDPEPDLDDEICTGWENEDAQPPPSTAQD